MKSALLITILFFLCAINAIAQDFSPYGYKHTPQGELHILIVFAEKTGDNYTMADWPLGVVPDWGFNIFETDVENIGDNNNLSKYYYELSKFTANPLKVTAFVYPDLISFPACSPQSAGMFLKA